MLQAVCAFLGFSFVYKVSLSTVSTWLTLLCFHLLLYDLCIFVFWGCHPIASSNLCLSLVLSWFCLLVFYAFLCLNWLIYLFTCAHCWSSNLFSLPFFSPQTCRPAIFPPLKDIYPGNVVDDLQGTFLFNVNHKILSNLVRFMYYEERLFSNIVLLALLLLILSAI